MQLTAQALAWAPDGTPGASYQYLVNLYGAASIKPLDEALADYRGSPAHDAPGEAAETQLVVRDFSVSGGLRPVNSMHWPQPTLGGTRGERLRPGGQGACRGEVPVPGSRLV